MTASFIRKIFNIVSLILIIHMKETKTIQTFLDTWAQAKGARKKRAAVREEYVRPARFIKLRPAGYPIRETPRNYFIGIDDAELFAEYAKDQWIGSIINVGDYLFDQRLIPDFAYKITRTLPLGTVRITEETKIELEKAEPKPMLHRWNVTLEDVIGQEAAKKKCRIVLKYLTEPVKFREWAPRNVLFYGAAGTGKTLLAKALASEAKANFILVRATDLIGEYVGEGAKRIHELYSLALESAPTVLFIDEVDAIGLDRAFQGVRGDVSEIVNAMLSELDGIKENIGVVTISATNNLFALDKALRSRFEEEIEFTLPNDKERYEIMKHYARKLPLGIEADLKNYVKETRDFSGRDLKEKFLKNALYKAILENAEKIADRHLKEALKEIKVEQKQLAPKEMFH